jgi:tryptophanyl-tRNA synthetase
LRRENETNEWLVVVANFTPNFHESYKIGVPLEGFYKEIFNSDGFKYGRKMSKSYDNTIPLFCTESQLKKYINKIKTNLLEPGESKDPNDSIIFEIWTAFATEEDSEFMRLAFKDGIGWGDAKQKLFHLINGSLIEARETYFQLLNKPEDIEEILNEGSKKARPLAQSRIKKIRESIGLKPLF